MGETIRQQQFSPTRTEELATNITGEPEASGSPYFFMTPDNQFQLHLNVENNHITAVELLSAHCSLSKQRIKQAMKNGSVWLTHNSSTCRLRRATKSLSSGDQIHFYYDSAIHDRQPSKPTLIEDNGLYSIWYKPRGMFSQGSKWGDHCAIGRWVETHFQPQRPAFIIHRLDRATSGIMVIAHTKKTAAFLANQFETRNVLKKYLAITVSPTTNDTFTVDDDIDGKQAKSHFQPLERHKSYSLLNITIETGRKHQIRKHLASQNTPILGDRLYGNKTSTSMKEQPDLQLTAYSLSFLCPIEKIPKTWNLADEYRPSLDKLPWV